MPSIVIPVQIEVPDDSPLLSAHAQDVVDVLKEVEDAVERALMPFHKFEDLTVSALTPYKGGHYHTIVLNPDGSRANGVSPQ